jgi:hypothetical protein
VGSVLAGLLAEVDDALMWSSTGPATVPVQDGAGAATALLEDVADRALRSEFKPDDGAGLVLSLRPSAIRVLNGL